MEKEQFERLEQLLTSYHFDSLSSKDKEWVIDHVGGENQYTALRNLKMKLAGELTIPVSRKVKKQLISQFKDQNRNWVMSILDYKIPGYAYAITLFLLTFIYFLIPEKVQVVEKLVISEPIIQTDTVIMQSEPDTIFIDRIKEVKVYLTNNETPNINERPKNPAAKSLADQQELRDLLIKSD